MRTSILILIFLILLPQWAWSNSESHKKKKVIHHKVINHRHSKVAKKGPPERYKLVTYYKNGKKMHKYIDTRPPKPEVVASASHEPENIPAIKYIDSKNEGLVSREPTSRDVLQSQVKIPDHVEQELDDKIPPPEIQN